MCVVSQRYILLSVIYYLPVGVGCGLWYAVGSGKFTSAGAGWLSGCAGTELGTFIEKPKIGWNEK